MSDCNDITVGNYSSFIYFALIYLSISLFSDNVTEYLALAEQADKVQILRIKQVFEKKNQKSNQTMAHLQKKLEAYHKRLVELEINGYVGPKRPKEVLHGMQQGLK